MTRMEPGDIEAQVKESGELALDLKGVGLRFSLLPSDLRSPRYRAEATGPDGVRRPLPPLPTQLFVSLKQFSN